MNIVYTMIFLVLGVIFCQVGFYHVTVFSAYTGIFLAVMMTISIFASYLFLGVRNLSHMIASASMTGLLVITSTYLFVHGEDPFAGLYFAVFAFGLFLVFLGVLRDSIQVMGIGYKIQY